jgi:hypothetical protein
MKKLSFLVLAVTLILTVMPAASAQAHVIEKDGTVQGIMHLIPAHKPTATEQATFEFFMSDSAREFDSKAYAYTLEVSGEGMATTSAPVTADGMTLKAGFVFPVPGEDFTASLVGSSTVAGVPSFSFEFDDISVLPAGQHENPITSFFGEHGGHALVIFLVILGFIGVVIEDWYIEPWIKRRWPKKS